MSARKVKMETLYLILMTIFGFQSREIQSALAKNSCADVRRAFVTQKIGPLRLVPYQAVRNQDLRVCNSSGLTCCNAQMEGKFQSAVKRDLATLIQRRVSSLKFNINSFTERFEDDVNFLTKKAEAVTSSTLKSVLVGRRDNGKSVKINEAIVQLYSTISLRSSPTELEASFKWFEDFIFNQMFASSTLSSDITMQALYEECTANQRRAINPFNNIPAMAFRNISSALKLALQFREALEVGKVTVNLTESTKLSKNCQAGLTRMVFCSHCFGLTLLRPCAQMCTNVARGCLAGFSEIGKYWSHYVNNLINISILIRSTDPSKNLDVAFMEFNRQLGSIIEELKGEKSEIKKKVSKECKRHLTGTKRSKRSTKRSRMQSPDDLLDDSPGEHPVMADSSQSSHKLPFMENDKPSKSKRQSRKTSSQSSQQRTRKNIRPPHQMLKVNIRMEKNLRQKTEAGDVIMQHQLNENKPETNLHMRIKRFAALFSQTTHLYRDLPDNLCDPNEENAVSVIVDGLCWDGNDIVDSYPRPVPDIGFQPQHTNPEVKVKSLDDKTIEVIKSLRAETQILMDILEVEDVPQLFTEQLEYEVKKKESIKKNINVWYLCDDEDDCTEGSGEDTTSTSAVTAPELQPTSESKKVTTKASKTNSQKTEKPSQKRDKSSKKKHRMKEKTEALNPLTTIQSRVVDRDQTTPRGGALRSTYNVSIQLFISFLVLNLYNFNLNDIFWTS